MPTIKTLKLSNFSNGVNNPQLRVINAALFKILIPEDYRRNPCSIKVISAICNRYTQDGEPSFYVTNPDPNDQNLNRYKNRSVFIRHNIGNTSYDSSNAGSNNLIGPLLFNNPNPNGISTLLQNTNSVTIGKAILPHEIVFERSRFLNSTTLEPLIGDQANDDQRIALIHVVLELTYDD
jgi:hypothetical protein|tara:strand:+ start:73 stop:609 length:537 start_codon:yes stop_codon:yes gene_type:complete